MIIEIRIEKERLYGLTLLSANFPIEENIFLNLVDTNFKRNNHLKQIFNRNSIRINYPCTNNISKIIYNPNWKLIDKLNLKD